MFSRVNAKVSFAGKRKFGERKLVSTRSVEHASGAGRQTSLACYIPRVASYMIIAPNVTVWERKDGPDQVQTQTP